MTPPRQSLTQRTLRGFLWNSAGAVSKASLNLLILIPLARLLTPADFGVVAAAVIVIRLAALFSELGVGAAVVQRPVLEPRHLSTAFTVSVLLGLAFGAALWAAAPTAALLLNIPAAEPVLRWLALLFPLKGAGLVAEALLQRDLRFGWLASRDVATFALSYGAIGVPLAFLGAGVWALVAADLGQAVLNLGARLWVHPPPRSLRPQMLAFRELFYFGWGHTLAKIGNFLAQQGDNLVVGRMLGAAALGLYNRAYQLMATPSSLLGGVLDRVLFPVMAKVQHDAARLALAYTRGVALIALVVCPASVALIILAPEIIAVLLGSQWEDVVLPFQLFAAGMVFRTSHRMSDSIARSTGFVYQRAWRQWIYAALVFGGAVFAQRWGINGVAIAVLGAITITFFTMAALSLRVCHMTWRQFFLAHVPALRLGVLAGVLAGATASLTRALGGPDLVVLIATLAVVGAGALGAARLAPNAFLGDLRPVVDTAISSVWRRQPPQHPPPAPTGQEARP